MGACKVVVSPFSITGCAELVYSKKIHFFNNFIVPYHFLAYINITYGLGKKETFYI